MPSMNEPGSVACSCLNLAGVEWEIARERASMPGHISHNRVTS